uniref:Disease resistance protein winged helix domain-containing protein n=1 Tax=Chenopodium quinoa TaxID=63459 RepID=A0A803NBL9_CHEQI
MEVFSKCSFGSEKLNHSEDSVKIGQEIVERCARNPLAIRVVGSFLFGQDESKWQSFLDIGLANFRESHDNITPIQLLSYHHLESPIKCCFSYCALFPKDFEIGKEILISLWMAQGYIMPLDKGQSIEDAGEEYFSILLWRCFFQDVKKNEDGEINSCKIHDLMHEIAQKVTQGEISAKTVSIDDLDKKVRHLSFDRSSFANYSFNNTHIRSFLNVNDNFQFVNMEQLLPVKALVAICKCLRALDLSELNIKSLSSSMGNLLHLRLQGLGASATHRQIAISEEEPLYFPSLEQLWLKNLPKSKGWMKSGVEVGDVHLSQLKSLVIDICPELTWIPLSPILEDLTCLFELRIKCDKAVESLAELGVILHSCSSSLRSLIIHDIHKLKTLYGGLEQSHCTGEATDI